MTISSEDFDKLFDEGEQDIIEHLNVSSAHRPAREVRRVNVDLPIWMIESLDTKAVRVGVTRQSIIKMWLAERLDHSRT